MTTYYLDCLKNGMGEHIIHNQDCPAIKNLIKHHLLLGDFINCEHLKPFAEWHFPDWNIKLCTCCQTLQINTQKAGLKHSWK